jgi:hypothetical protein
MTAVDTLRRYGFSAGPGAPRLTKRMLANILSVPPREVEAQIEQARKSGVPICSDSEGYWYSEDPDEIEATYRSLRRRFLSQIRTAWALRGTARRLRAPQETLGL